MEAVEEVVLNSSPAELDQLKINFDLLALQYHQIVQDWYEFMIWSSPELPPPYTILVSLKVNPVNPHLGSLTPNSPFD